jgi:hypothetical protein
MYQEPSDANRKTEINPNTALERFRIYSAITPNMKDEKGDEIPDSGISINSPIGGILLVEPTETKPVTDATRDAGKISDEMKSFYCSNPQPMSKEDKKEDK